MTRKGINHHLEQITDYFILSFGNFWVLYIVKEVEEAVELTDNELIEKIKEQDENAFRELIDRHRDRLVNFCSRYLGDKNEGEDVAQEICVLVYEKIETFRGDSQFSTWLYRIAVNQCKNRYGSWWNRLKRHGKRVSSVDRETSEIAVVSDDKSAESQIRQSELGEYLMERIAELPHQFRQVILLRDVEDKTYDEIAEITGSSAGTVKSRLNRARKQLQTKLEGVRNDF